MKIKERYTVSSATLNAEQLRALLSESARLCNVDLQFTQAGHRALATYTCTVQGEAQDHERFTRRLDRELVR
ncbi:hypothetical protein [Deinococcus peraridilitoris]|uniref:Uncharacterized protein n=1 Tax=Deinococcus peraridilitoris (strain DSM 19664 / LMG 22246 / CIP 109416 / KR-200) TaxID=937777 RepID=L0A0R8_DEIPD|nr:hypothetical protein [Deinococcus peraridilitoris]AFZ67488.1 hypothetical protein Deipe_1989 [Deinococcus peraridilitoris DSM 19664]